MTEPLPSVGTGEVGYRGRSQLSAYQSPVLVTQGRLEAPILVVIWHPEEFANTGLESGFANICCNSDDSSFAGSDPYAGSLTGSWSVGVGSDDNASVRHQVYVYDALPEGSVSECALGGLAPNWGGFPPWPTPPSSGLPEYFFVGVHLDDFSPDDNRDGSTRTIDFAMWEQTVGTAESTVFAHAPAIDPLTPARRNCLTIRGVFNKETYLSTLASGIETFYTPHTGEGDCSDCGLPPCVLPAGDSTPVYCMKTDGGYTTGGWLTGVPQEDELYESEVSSEEVVGFTIVLSYPQTTVPNEPVAVDPSWYDPTMTDPQLPAELEPVDTPAIDPPLPSWLPEGPYRV